ncbi:MAG: hypothetical protein GX661_00630 [Acholeplasmataceae bacterium]|nr:hypothetical protein [Acholeplasmataceae bacterium]
MFVYYDNFSENKKVEVESVPLLKNGGLLYCYPVVDGDKNLEIYVRLCFINFSKDEVLKDIYLYLAYENPVRKCNFYLYEDECREVSGLQYETVPRISSNATVEDHTECKVTYEESERMQIKYAKFNITRIARKALERNIMKPYFNVGLRIINDATSNITIFDPKGESENSVVVTGYSYKANGMHPTFHYEEQNIGAAGVSKIKICSGKQFLVNNFLTTSDNKMPICLGLLYNQLNAENNIGGFFGRGMRASFEYRMMIGESLLLIDPSDGESYFSELTYNKAKEKYPLEIDQGYTGRIFGSVADASYALYQGNEITVCDSNQNKMVFECQDNVGLLKKIINATGDSIQFIRNSENKVILIESNTNAVHLSYSEGRISEARIPHEKRLYSFYYSNSFLIHINVYSYKIVYPSGESSEVIESSLIGGARYDFSNSRLSQAYDKRTGRGFEYTYDESNRIYKTHAFVDSGSTFGEYLFLNYGDKCTLIKSVDNQVAYYFDHYGRNRLIIDKYGRSITCNYAEINDDVSCQYKNISNPQNHSFNLLENHSFESDDDILSTTTGWLIQKGSGSSVKTELGGVYGEKYLLIEKSSGDTVKISQKISRPSTGTSIFKGFIKYKKEGGNLLAGEIKVSVRKKYTVKKEVQIPASSSNSNGSTTEIKEVTYEQFHQPDNPFTGQADWTEFTVSPIYIPYDAYGIEVEVIIQLTGGNYKVGIDDLQYSLEAEDRKVRYNYIENGYMEFVTGNKPKVWVFENCNTTDISIVKEEANAFHKSSLGENVVQIKGTIGTIKQMKQTINMQGNAGDELIFSVFSKANTNVNDYHYAFVKIHYLNRSPVTYNFYFEHHYSTWQALTRNIIAEYPFDQVEVGGAYDGWGAVLFDAFQLYKDDYGKHYNYDQRGNIIEVANSSIKDSANIRYDEKNQLQEFSDVFGETYRFTYENKRVKTISDIKNNLVSYTYDNRGNCTEVKIESKAGTIITSQDYDGCDNPTTILDERKKTTEFIYDELNRLKKMLVPNGLVTDYSYNKYGQLENIISGLDDNQMQGTYSYNNKGLLNKIQAANGTVYDFTYDTFGNLTKVQVDNQTYCEYKYKNILNINSGLIQEKKYPNQDTFTFGYDNKRRLTTIHRNNQFQVRYKYNEMDLVNEIYDALKGTKKYLDYDKNGNLVKVFDGENTIIYVRDNLGNTQKAIYKIDNKIRDFEYEHPYEFNDYSFSGYIQRLDKAFMDDIIVSGFYKDGKYGCKQLYNNIEPQEAGEPTILYLKKQKQLITYDLTKTNLLRKSSYSRGKNFNLGRWQDEFKKNKSIYLWIKPEGSFEGKRLITLTADNQEVFYIDIQSNGKLKFGCSFIQEEPLITDSSLNLNQLNLIGLNVRKENNNLEVLLTLNSNNKSKTYPSIYQPENQYAIKIETINRLSIGKFVTNNIPNYETANASPNMSMAYQIPLISVGAYQHTFTSFRGIRNEGMKYLKNDLDLIMASGVIYYNHDIYSDFDVITLNGSLYSKKGLKPLSHSYTDNSFRFDKAKLFKLDETSIDSDIIKKHVYGSYSDMDNLNPGNKAKLTYDLHLKTKGSIFVRIKPDDIECLNRYIISVQTGNTIRLGLMIRNNYLALVHNNTIYTSELAIEPEYWQTVGIRFGDGTITINCNKQQKVFNLNVNLTGCFTAIGTNIVNDQPENHLTGVMEMLCFADYTVDNNFVNKLVDDGATIIVRKTYDELNRCKKLERFVGSAKFITDYEYEENADDTTTTLINKESNDDGKSIEYQYDDVGNITKITHKENATVKDTYEYAYDIFSRLENEEYKEGNVFKHHLEYTYDTNNNIKFIISKDGNNNIIKKTEFKYKNANNIICDRLKEIVETTYGSTITSKTTTIEYNDFIGNPSRWIQLLLKTVTSLTIGRWFVFIYILN